VRQRVLDLVAPRRVLALLSLAFRAARKAAGRWLPAWRMPPDHRRALHRGLETHPGGEEYPAEAGPRARSGLLPGPGLQPGGYAGPPHRVPLGGRLWTRREPRRSLRGAPPARRAPGVTSASSGKAPHGLRWQLGVRLGAAPLLEIVTAVQPVRTDPVRARYCERRRTWVSTRRSLTCDTAPTYGRAMSRGGAG